MTDLQFPNITPEQIERYIFKLNQDFSKNTTKRKISVLTKFYEWAKKEGLVEGNHISQVVNSKTSNSVPKEAEISRSTPSLPDANNSIEELDETVDFGAKPPSQDTIQSAPAYTNSTNQSLSSNWFSYLLKTCGLGVLIIVILLLLTKFPYFNNFFGQNAGAPELDRTTATSTPDNTQTNSNFVPNQAVNINTTGQNSDIVVANGVDTIIKSMGNLLISGEAVTLTTNQGSGGDINIMPDGQGTTIIGSNNQSDSSLFITNANLTTGTLIEGVVGNNFDSGYLIELKSGSPLQTRFSVDTSGDTYVDGEFTVNDSINIASGGLDVGGVTRITDLGRLGSITGYYQGSGLFEIDQGTPDYARISKVLNDTTGYSTADVLTLTLDESNNTTGSSSNTLVLDRLGGTGGYALLVDSGNAKFDGQVQLGSFTSNPTAIDEGSIIYNSTDNALYLWNGSGWTALGGGSVSGFWQQNSGVLSPTTTTNDLAVGGTTAASAGIYLADTGDAVFNEQGNDADFRIEGDTEDHLLFADAGADNVTIGTFPTSLLLSFTSNYRLGAFTTSTRTSGNEIASAGKLAANPASAPSSGTTYSGGQFTAATASGSSVDFSNGRVYGATASANHLGTDTLGVATALSGSISNNTTGTISSATVIGANLSNASTGTIDSGYGFWLQAPSNSSGTINNLYGIYLSDVNVGSNNYAIVTNDGNIVFNEGADASTDFRVEGATDANLLFVDAGVNNIGIGTNSPDHKVEVSGYYGGNALVSLDDTGGNDIFTASASANPVFTIHNSGLTDASTDGIATKVVAGAITDGSYTGAAVDGLLGVDSSNGRIYFRYGGAWHYAAQTAGFQIPDYETFAYNFDTSSFDKNTPIEDGDFLLPFAEKRLSDGAIHGLYARFSDVKDTIFKNINAGVITVKKFTTEELAAKTAQVVNFIGDKITAGAITTKDFVSDGAKIANAEIKSLVVTGRLTSPVVETNMISPVSGTSSLAIRLGSEKEPGVLSIEDANGNDVANINSSGNAEFDGKITSRSLKTQDATISGTLHAGKIYADEIVPSLDQDAPNYDDLLAQLTSVEEDQKALSDLLSEMSTTNSTSEDITPSEFDSITTQTIYATERGTFQNISVVSTLAIGTDFVISANSDGSGVASIDTISSPLQIQSLAMADIKLMAGKVTITTDGNVEIAGDLVVHGTTSTDKVIIAGGSDEAQTSITDTSITTNATAGHSTLPKGKAEITIKNPKVTDLSLVYVTPTSETQNKVMFVKEKANGHFKVGFIDPLDQDVEFNWWIIDILPRTGKQ